jgi:glutamine---fructose-6-phosphate transaminase (isomerizing)
MNYAIISIGGNMCGIVGYIGSKNAVPILTEGLERLEYRGYDSAGIAVLENGKIEVRKIKGRLACLKDLLAEKPAAGDAGIGHTRWATHGEPSDLNAHPHTDVKGHIAVVHNGIIENYAALRAYLTETGCAFVSQTDTEVIAHLINHLYKGDMLQAIIRACNMLEGSYALGIVSSREPDALFCVRKDSPLVVGLSSGEQFIASDVPAILAHTREVIFLKDKEIAILRREGVTLCDQFGCSREIETAHIPWDIAAAEKGGYPHFMLKEINEEPDALSKTFTAHADSAAGAPRPGMFPLTITQVKDCPRIQLLACGTAFHAAMLGKHMIENLAGIPVSADIASEYRYRDPIVLKGEICLVVSQSGETADTLAALREARRKGATLCALTNAVGSSITRESEGVLYTYAGPEIAVASTKAYVTQVEMFAMIAIDLAVKRGSLRGEDCRALLTDLSRVPAAVAATLLLKENIQRFADRNRDNEHVFYIGRGLDHALAMEASLKLKEVSYVFSEAYAAGELKHGTIALIEPGSLVVAIMTQPALADKTLSNIREVKARGARVLALAGESLAMKARQEADEVWAVPDVNALFMPIPAIIPLQLFAYYMAVERGCDVDKPRNLAKSVTVE